LSLPSIIKQAAKYEFYLKPAAALATIYSGIPLCHKSYWNKKSPDEIVALHSKLTADILKVLSMLDASNIHSPAEERVYGFLVSMVGNMKMHDLKLFLHFVTGCSVCITSKINVKFNNLTAAPLYVLVILLLNCQHRI